MSAHSVHYSTGKDNWATPDAVFEHWDQGATASAPFPSMVVVFA